MSKSITVSYGGAPCYDILLEQDFQALTAQLQKAGLHSGKKACIVTDENLARLHLEELKRAVTPYFSRISQFIFPAGEESKHLDTVQALYQALIEDHFDRHDLLIAFGGGVVGDLTGFAAATYLRGIDFIQIPTSILSQVDSSIGGKTGVDFSQYKNMVGAFYQPRLVYMNLSLLQTLPKEQFLCGMGEVLKHGLIRSGEYFSWLREKGAQILSLHPETLEEMIYQSCLIKRAVVERDPKEAGERALLNFGHTIGHAIEKLSNFGLFHGQCVAIGMAAACQISCEAGSLSKEERQSVLAALQQFDLPVTVEGLSADEILAVSKSDKKMNAGKVRFILLTSIGNAVINPDLTDAEILDGIRSVLHTG